MLICLYLNRVYSFAVMFLFFIFMLSVKCFEKPAFKGAIQNKYIIIIIIKFKLRLLPWHSVECEEGDCHANLGLNRTP